jgi:hypothetical protein
MIMMSRLRIEALVNFTIEENHPETQLMAADIKFPILLNSPGDRSVAGIIKV